MDISKEEIEKLRKHMGLAQEFKIGNDTFHFKPLNAEDIPDLIEIIRVFKNAAESGKEDTTWLDAMDRESMLKLIKLLKKMVSISYPDLSEEEVKSFVSANFINLTIIMMQINDLGAKNVNRIQEKLAELRSRRMPKQAKANGGA
ncbi:MAG: hypothetical protein DRH37_06630 [Deltaproteobacteria bacterium]|nr:MAG: hypothetical protein DRH37_06630 [Deltaproteobacteria bacterium]